MRDERSGEDQVPWIVRDTSWSRVGLVLAAVLFVLAPFVRRKSSRPTLLAYLQLPMYMLHQYEEHGHGAFKREANALIPSSAGPLSDRTIFVTNVPLVWGVEAAVTALTATKSPRLALLSPYLAVFNGLLHVGMALFTRRYNPGLGTSLALFLPVGLASIRAIGRDTAAPRRAHLGAAAVAAWSAPARADSGPMGSAAATGVRPLPRGLYVILLASFPSPSTRGRIVAQSVAGALCRWLDATHGAC